MQVSIQAVKLQRLIFTAYVSFMAPTRYNYMLRRVDRYSLRPDRSSHKLNWSHIFKVKTLCLVPQTHFQFCLIESSIRIFCSSQFLGLCFRTNGVSLLPSHLSRCSPCFFPWGCNAPPDLRTEFASEKKTQKNMRHFWLVEEVVGMHSRQQA